MPTRAPRVCQHCRKTFTTKVCESCKKKKNNQYKKNIRANPLTTDSFYSCKTWRAVRATHLRSEPLCRACSSKGLTVIANIVDHIMPIKQGGEKYDSSNLQSLCTSCHNRKSVLDGSKGDAWGNNQLESN